MKTLFQIALAAGAVFAAVPAQASAFIFATDTRGSGTASRTAGNVFSYETTTTDADAASRRTVRMKVSGWALGIDGRFSATTLDAWAGHGLGMLQVADNVPRFSQADTGYHQIDNVNGWEFAVLQFDTPVTLTGGVFNAYRLWDRAVADNDAFVGGTTLAGSWDQVLTADRMDALRGALLANGVNTDNSTFADPAVQTFGGPRSAGSNLWIVGGSVDGPDGHNDAFKIARISGTIAAPVPEPGTWMLMLAGFGLLGYAVRRDRARTRAALAA